MAVDSKLSEVTELEHLGVAQVIQYADDVLEAWTNDGARFLVSSCGTAFTHWRRLHNSWEKTHQYTHFCLSAYKDQMAALILFRNCHSDRPFLCSSLVNATSRTSLDYKSAFWPQNLSQARSFITHNGLSLELKSREGSALVILHQHAQSFTVYYLGKLCEGEQTFPHSSNSSAELDTACCWVTQRHSIMSIPDCWQHPVSLLLKYRQHLLHGAGDGCDEHTSSSQSVSTSLPTALPHSCTNAHLHQLEIATQSRNHRVKVMYCEGILYRLFPGCQTPCVEVTPCGSVLLRSHDVEGRFFQSWSCLSTGEVCDQLYCNDHLPPPTAHLGYSVSRVLGQGRRLLATSSVPSTPPCWELQSVPQIPNLVMESMDVPGLGCFTAYKSGWVRICFLDRAQLDFHCPELAVHKEPSLKLDRFTELAPNMCRLMLPNGRYETFSVTSPLQFAWYAHIAVRWATWVGTPGGERGDFTVEEDQGVTMKRKVMADNIESIESALEVSPSHTMEWTGDRNTIQEALARTKAALYKTDKLLHQ